MESIENVIFNMQNGFTKRINEMLKPLNPFEYTKLFLSDREIQELELRVDDSVETYLRETNPDHLTLVRLIREKNEERPEVSIRISTGFSHLGKYNVSANSTPFSEQYHFHTLEPIEAGEVTKTIRIYHQKIGEIERI